MKVGRSGRRCPQKGCARSRFIPSIFDGEEGRLGRPGVEKAGGLS